MWSHSSFKLLLHDKNTNREYERHLFVARDHHEYLNSDSKRFPGLDTEQKAHYGPIVRAQSTKTQPVYSPLLDTAFLNHFILAEYEKYPFVSRNKRSFYNKYSRTSYCISHVRTTDDQLFVLCWYFLAWS